MITGTAVLIVVISFTVIELALGQSLIGGRETTFPTPKPEPKTLLVPRVVGLPEAEARQRLQDRGFDVAIAERRYSSRPRGFVDATGPGGGRPAEEGSVVKLWLSLGARVSGVLLPDLRNLPAAEAKTELEALGLKFSERIEYDGEAEIGSVERTDPQGPQTVMEHSTVTVFSSGGEGQQLPDVRNRHVDEARSELETLGFEVVEGAAEPSADVEIDEVVRTDPQGPPPAGKGSRVTLVRSLGPPVTVPELAEQSLEHARAELLASGLTVGDTLPEPSDGVPPNSVIRSDPVAGEQVSRGTPVNLVISSGPP